MTRSLLCLLAGLVLGFLLAARQQGRGQPGQHQGEQQAPYAHAGTP